MVGHVGMGPVIRHGFEMALNYCQTNWNPFTLVGFLFSNFQPVAQGVCSKPCFRALHRLGFRPVAQP